MRVPLVDGHGNFGSLDGDAPAAYRYTEARLTAAAAQLLAELGAETVDFRDNFDGTGKEPIVLPARFPQLLVNGGTGIAVGMATSIPPHNLGEVMRAVHRADRRARSHDEEAAQVRQGPGLPDRRRSARDAGRARRDLRDRAAARSSCAARWKLEEKQAGPAHRHHRRPVRRGEGRHRRGDRRASSSRRSCRALDRRQDLSTTDMRVELELDQEGDVDPELVMAYLFKHTRLQVSVKVDMTVPRARPRTPRSARRRGSTSRQILQHFVDFRFKTVRRRLEYDLGSSASASTSSRASRRSSTRSTRRSSIIRASDGKADAAAKLMKAFALDDDPGRRDPRDQALQAREARDPR